MCCGGSTDALGCLRSRAKSLTDEELKKIKEKVDKAKAKKIEEEKKVDAIVDDYNAYKK